jgi:Lrp/AsnC family leucine-responsive transcriptional regulator
MLSEIDRKILDIVQVDARLSMVDIGERLGVSASTVHERMKRLQAAGVVRQVGLVDPKALGFDVLAFTLVLLDRPERDSRFVNAMRAEAQVQEIHHVTGEWSYWLKLRARDTADLERLLSQVVKAQSGVVRSLTQIVLSSAKETPALPAVLP